MRELFIWYLVRNERVDEARDAVQAMQSSLATSWPGLQARLLTRAGDAGAQTWMETYSCRAGSTADDTGIGSDIEAAIEAAAGSLAIVIDGDRHAEAFVVARSP